MGNEAIVIGLAHLSFGLVAILKPGARAPGYEAGEACALPRRGPCPRQ